MWNVTISHLFIKHFQVERLLFQFKAYPISFIENNARGKMYLAIDCPNDIVFLIVHPSWIKYIKFMTSLIYCIRLSPISPKRPLSNPIQCIVKYNRLCNYLVRLDVIIIQVQVSILSSLILIIPISPKLTKVYFDKTTNRLVQYIHTTNNCQTRL